LSAGNVLPFLIIFVGCWKQDKVSSPKYRTGDKGWINTELFESWFSVFSPLGATGQQFTMR